jgi:glycosyltransferase A (GT-A) superfamily protein (DUF2064 family)
MHSNRSSIIVFSEPLMAAPAENQLGVALTAEEALQFREATLIRIVETVATAELPSLEKSVFLAGSLEHAHRSALELRIPDCFSIEAQYGSALAERLEHALGKKFNEGFQKVVLMGVDCPFLSVPLIEQALDLLSSHDVVIGPTASEGCYLIGFSVFVPAIIRGVHWEEPSVLRQLEGLIALHSLKGSFLESLSGWRDLEGLKALASQANREAAGQEQPASDRLSQAARQILERKSILHP